MLQFQIHHDSEIPASKELFDQIRFAIAAGAVNLSPIHRVYLIELLSLQLLNIKGN
jgi:hypothetical protein